MTSEKRYVVRRAWYEDAARRHYWWRVVDTWQGMILGSFRMRSAVLSVAARLNLG